MSDMERNELDEITTHLSLTPRTGRLSTLPTKLSPVVTTIPSLEPGQIPRQSLFTLQTTCQNIGSRRGRISGKIARLVFNGAEGKEESGFLPASSDTGIYSFTPSPALTQG